MIKIPDRIKTIENAVYTTWNDLQSKGYSADGYSLWLSSRTEIELIEYQRLSSYNYHSLMTDIADFTKPPKRQKLSLFGMIIEIGSKLTDNQIVVCSGSTDDYGIPSYKRRAVIEIKSKTTYDFDVKLEPAW